MPIGATMTQRLFLPVYMALSGYRTDFAELAAAEETEKWCALELLVALCISGKLVGCVAARLFFAMPIREAVVLNVRGIVEVAAIDNWGDTMKATAEHYTVLTLSMVLITALSTPLIKLLYDPSRQFLLLAKRRRTMEESMSSAADLRVRVHRGPRRAAHRSPGSVLGPDVAHRGAPDGARRARRTASRPPPPTLPHRTGS
jgi:hypothetical protein